MKKIATLLAVFATLAMPGMALAQGSGGDAYTEDIPGPGGNPPSSEGGGGGDGSLPGDTQSDFAAQGDDGAAAADLAQSTSPQSTSPDGKGSDGGGQGAGQNDDASTASGSPDSDSSGFGEIMTELVGGSDDGMGLLLPIILGSVLVAAVAFVIVRRSGGSTGSA